MRAETTYYADDGTEFDNEKECHEYEAKMKFSLGAVKFYDIDFKECTDADAIYAYGIYAVIRNKDGAMLAFDYLYESIGMIKPIDDVFSDGDILEWDETKWDWINISKEFIRIKSIITCLNRKAWQ